MPRPRRRASRRLPSGPIPRRRWPSSSNLFKYHAACYLTHSPIEAIRELKRQHNIGPDDVKLMTLHIDPGHLKVCCIPEPKTGLEIKFGLQHLAGMALAGADTAALGTYSDENANDPRYIAIRQRVKLDPQPRQGRARHGADVSMELNDGRKVHIEMNVGVPAKDVAAQEAKLVAKFHSLAEPVIGRQRTKTALDMIMRLRAAAEPQGSYGSGRLRFRCLDIERIPGALANAGAPVFPGSDRSISLHVQNKVYCCRTRLTMQAQHRPEPHAPVKRCRSMPQARSNPSANCTGLNERR